MRARGATVWSTASSYTGELPPPIPWARRQAAS